MNRWLPRIAAVEGIVLVALFVIWLTTSHEPGSGGSDPVGRGRMPGETDRSTESPSSSSPYGRNEQSTRRDSNVVSDQDHAPDQEASAAPAGAPPDTGILVVGRITDPEGRPVPDVNMIFGGIAGVSLNAQSAYALPGMTPGPHRLHLEAQGFVGEDREVTIAPAPAEQRFDFTMVPAFVVPVRMITPEGIPLMDALRARPGLHAGSDVDVVVTAVATEERLEYDLPMTSFERLWGFGLGPWRWRRQLGDLARTVPEDCTGVLDVRTKPPFWVSAVLRHAVIDSVLVAGPVREVVLTIPVDAVLGKLASFRVRVIDADTGTAVGSAKVALSDLGSLIPADAMGADGWFGLENLPPGLKFLSIAADGYEEVREGVRLVPGRILDLGTVRIAREVTVSGSVLDEAGQPSPGHITCCDLARRSVPQPMHGEAETQSPVAADGSFVITGAGRSRLLLTAYAGYENQGRLVVDTTAGPVEGLRITLRRSPRVTVEASVDRSRYLLFTAEDAEMRPVWSSHVTGPESLSFCAPPGEYTMSVHEDDRLLRTVPFSIGTEDMKLKIRP